MPGGGKSTVGRGLAKRLGWRFADTDSLVESAEGRTIKAIFESHGEARFRELETQAIADAMSLNDVVVATGGGAVLSAANRRMLHERSHVVYLQSSPEELFRRLRHDVQRPLLQVADPLAVLRAMHGTRDPLYRETAHFVVETGRPTVNSLVNMVLMQLELAGVIDAARVPSPVTPPRTS